MNLLQAQSENVEGDVEGAFFAIIESKELSEKILKGQMSVGTVLSTHRNWTELIVEKHIKDIDTAMRLQAPSISALRWGRGEKYAVMVVLTIIKNAIQKMNIGNTMNDAQILDTAREILEDYGFLKLSELKFAFSQGAKGIYGQNYNRLDISILYDWIRQYTELRMERCERNEMQRASQFKKQEMRFDDLPIDVKQKFINLSKEIEKKGSEAGKNDLAAKIIKTAALLNIEEIELLQTIECEFKQSDTELSQYEFTKAFLESSETQRKILKNQ